MCVAVLGKGYPQDKIKRLFIDRKDKLYNKKTISFGA